ncbi:T-cell surface glycoprotein CD3 epsilon chain [Marmota marmota marmota]|uniref:T-cell surface glycoprotein CD3 epsilon chain n=1 Tax=Marmota marmota marmota TaxID=9994 RepID=A0A8C6EZ67_MARMA|nr:T-cell surface glycoprotein CD3 epsilon chain [Marmota marmota marmota]
MQSSTLWGVLGLCLLSVGAWGQEDDEENDDLTQIQYKVSISGTDVMLTCPPKALQGTINWERNDKKLEGENDEQLLLKNFSEMDNSGYYACYTTPRQKENIHFLYLRARVCENCVEVDLTAVATVIVVDIIVTLGLLMLVYYWSKNRKAKSKPVTRGAGAGGRPRGQKKERPPPVPNPDYEPIRKGQQDLYSGLNQRGI